jgi:hypothetical protein
VRVAFRFLFTLPLLVVAGDALRAGASHPVLTRPLLTDALLLLAGVGCFVSSGATVLIFFPWPAPGADESPSLGSVPSLPYGADERAEDEWPKTPPRRHSSGSLIAAGARARWTGRGEREVHAPAAYPYAEHFVSPIGACLALLLLGTRHLPNVDLYDVRSMDSRGVEVAEV